jgi:O-antigen/teichoic acid export membrane protein
MINQVIYIVYPVVFYFLVFHYEFITAYFSLKYKESAVIFAIYTCTCLIRINDYQDVLVASGNSKYILRSNVYYSICNILLVILLGYFFKGVGIAVASFISVVFLAFMLLRYDAIILSKKVRHFFELKNILKLALFCLLFLLVIYWALQYFKISSIKTIVFSGVLYFPAAYFILYKFNFYDKSIAKALLSKIPGFKK